MARPRLTWARHDHGRLAVDHLVAVVHLRVGLQRLHHRVADQVGVGHLAAAGPAQVVVDHHALVDQQLDRQRADAGGGRHGQRAVHVLGGAGRRARAGWSDRLLQRHVRPVRRVGRVGRHAAAGARGWWAGSPCLAPVAPRSAYAGRRAWALGGGAGGWPCGSAWAGAGAGPRRSAGWSAARRGGRRRAGAALALGPPAPAGSSACPSAVAWRTVGLEVRGPGLVDRAGSAEYCSYISSSSQSLAPKSSRRVRCWVIGRARWPQSPSSWS